MADTIRLEVQIELPERSIEVDRLGYRLVGYLEHNATVENPRTAAQIVTALGLSTDSEVQSIVHDLRGHHGVLIASNVASPHGYFLATQETIIPTYNRIHKIAMSNLYAWSGLKRGIVERAQMRLL